MLQSSSVRVLYVEGVLRRRVMATSEQKVIASTSNKLGSVGRFWGKYETLSGSSNIVGPGRCIDHAWRCIWAVCRSTRALHAPRWFVSCRTIALGERHFRGGSQ